MAYASRILLLAALIAPPAMSQGFLDRPVGREIQYGLHSGSLSNPGPTVKCVFSDIIEVDGASWMQLRFDEAILGTGSYVRMTSLLDGGDQDLDAELLAEWDLKSAYFNGPAVQLEVFAGPATRNLFSISTLLVEYGGELPAGSCGICGADNRLPSSVDWSFRILNVGCSGSIYNAESCAVSAGHCASGGQTAQFRVPASTPGCGLVNPPPEDQFPVTSGPSENGGVGADWWVMTVGRNNLNQKPFDRYGVFLPIAPVLPNVGDTANVWGYGIDSECVRTQVQQDSGGGPITLKAGTWWEFNIDITFGNSGSGLINDQEIIGVVTHCSDNCPDFATRVDKANFRNARDSTCPPPPDDCPGDCTNPTNYGQGTPGTGGFVPTNTWTQSEGCSYLGNQSFTVVAAGFLGGATGLLLFGFDQDNDSSAGWTRLVDPAGAIPTSYPGAGPGNGTRTVILGIPNNPFLDGLDVFLQFTAFDAGAPAGVSATRGLAFTLCN